MTTKPKKRGECGCYLPRMEGHDFTCRFHPEKVARTKKRRRSKITDKEMLDTLADQSMGGFLQSQGPGFIRTFGMVPTDSPQIVLRKILCRLVRDAAIRAGRGGSHDSPS